MMKTMVCRQALLIVLLTITTMQPIGASPLKVHASNPRYFTDGSGKLIYLTGSHTWDNFHDLTPKQFDYTAYLDFLEQYNHNFIRFWSGSEMTTAEPSVNHRTGPGTALDGSPKIDLTKFNQRYFERLRSRTIEAGQRGFYVSVMLFQGDNVLNEGKNKNWPHHVFNSENNINKINGDPNGDGVGLESHTLRDPAIVALQAAYVRKVIDTLNDLDNVLYEISNEEVGAPRNPDNSAWQYHWIKYIKQYEATKKPKQHPVVMTAQWPARDANAVLFASPADAISPAEESYKHDPAAADGKKVILADVDHIFPSAPQTGWVWRSFARGLQPVLMDWYHWGDPDWISSAEQDAMRRNMGYTRTYATKINLAAMTPSSELASTGYCLANLGAEYLVYLPTRKRQGIPIIGRFFRSSVVVDLRAASGEFDVEWFNPATGKAMGGGTTFGGAFRTFNSPFPGDAVLYLKAGARRPLANPMVPGGIQALVRPRAQEATRAACSPHSSWERKCT
jgi:Family of unknown function (DUF6298)/Protein of unknown function (DUF4038)